MHYSADSPSTPSPNYVSQMRTAAPLEDTHIPASNIPVIAEYWLWLTSSMTKAIAEKMVLQENDSSLCTTAIRPHLIWGPGDPHLIPRILQKANANRLMIVGEGMNQVDMTYIDNAVSAHLKAALAPNSKVAGKAYFVSDDDPVFLWEWINNLLNRLGISVVTRKISYSNAMRLGTFLELVYGFLRLKSEPPMTRFLASQLATSHYFDISKAKKDFNYQPLVSQEEGINHLIRSLKFPHQGD